MFNNFYLGGETQNNKCEVHLNQPSTGFIQKSNPVSRFIRFQRGSEIEKKLFPTDPALTPHLDHETTDLGYRRVQYKKEVVILQVCIFGDDYMLAEYIFKDDLKDENK